MAARTPAGIRACGLLVIVYALLPLLFLALLSSSSSLGVPGFAYSLYVAPLWAIAFWLLLRPGRIAAQEIYIGIAIIVWVTIWLYVVTININDHLVNAVRNGNFLAALIVGYNEEITKALPILLAALILLKFRATKLDVRMWMFLGTISGLTFGILEERLYTEMAIAQVANASAVSQADAGVLDFAFRVFVDGFEHAVWAGVSAFFIGIAINYPRRRWQLIVLGISMVACCTGSMTGACPPSTRTGRGSSSRPFRCCFSSATRCRRPRSSARSAGRRCSGETRWPWTSSPSRRTPAAPDPMPLSLFRASVA